MVAKWDVKKAINVCGVFKETGIEWLEEPLHGYDFEGLAELRRSTTLNIAGGELNAQVHEYRDMLKHQCFDGCGSVGWLCSKQEGRGDSRS